MASFTTPQAFVVPLQSEYVSPFDSVKYSPLEEREKEGSVGVAYSYDSRNRHLQVTTTTLCFSNKLVRGGVCLSLVRMVDNATVRVRNDHFWVLQTTSVLFKEEGVSTLTLVIPTKYESPEQGLWSALTIIVERRELATKRTRVRNCILRQE